LKSSNLYNMHQLSPGKGVWILFLALALGACTKETIIVGDNEPPIINNVPAIKIENYVNRIFIDLLGREPLDEEMEAEAQALRDAALSTDAREALLLKLQTDESFIEGDTSYQRAYHQHLYNLAKVRCIEGASDALLWQERNMAQTLEDSMRLEAVIDSRIELQEGVITIEEMFGRMIYNNIYDQINMNTFNFVQASFDNLYWRYPTQAEFDAGFNMVEFEETVTFLGETGSSRDDYVEIITENQEMFEGLIIWVYQQLLSRRPTTEETAELLNDFYQHRDIRIIQRHIMVTDEYANF
jgi:hypothetical protein